MDSVWATLGAAFISATAAIIVCMIQHRKSTSIIEFKVEDLKTEVEKHNKLIERTYELEKNVEIIKTDIKVANHRIDDLEKKRG